MTDSYLSSAQEVISRCRVLATHSEEPGCLTRTFLSEAMRAAYREVQGWMESAEMCVHIDRAGNLRGTYGGAMRGKRLIIGSHLDTVPRAGMFDGALGVVLGIELIRLLRGRGFSFPVEVIGFSEEEGVRFGTPFIGSRAVIGDLTEELLARQDARGISVEEAIRQFGLESAQIDEPMSGGSDYMEFHIEQGPVLESLHLPLGIVTAIVGQSRLELIFTGAANHAGTTPMSLRRDALAGAAEWIGAVEKLAVSNAELVATVGRADVRPGAGNIVPGIVTVSLDVRHPNDDVRARSVHELLQCANQTAAQRGLTISSRVLLDQPAVRMNNAMTNRLAGAVERCGYPVHHMNSGAGHDAMIMARKMPVAMLFLRSPGAISHHPDESVLVEDVAAALSVGMAFLRETEAVCLSE